MSKIKAVFFDQDGVIIDTERDGHRVSFNMTFKEFGFTDEWSVEYYHELLQIAGGKERMKHHWKTKGFSKPLTEEEIDNLVKEMHKRKTALFVELIETGKLPLRPGIHRFMKELMEAGIKIGVCTTSNEQAAKAITERVLSDIKFEIVLAGDVVEKKKPDPEIYNLGLAKLGLKTDEAFVVEDSKNGVKAAKAAGLKTIVTTNSYTEKEDVEAGDVIVSCLGDPNGEKATMRKGGIKDFDGVVHVKQIIELFG
ncbi:MAG: HAD-IA family hydrolase [Anaerolineales bacterium]|jgi:HAD superfamily hydrolase (TIGR01509 family)|uniref:HAD-IA family hydrolase n=1 Tax=Candidatus Villigracilis affinis TaxID=3140682 RepID=UPI001D26146A|nr:HAD-IA family hydrolase [Anaerolineales bacterium]MBK9601658.1 HAD-IA family hydrolase [Anaerolineales bacterium]MBL0345089.1 HAD-IA family hydrolase [Anaerolineales bacterium]